MSDYTFMTASPRPPGDDELRVHYNASIDSVVVSIGTHARLLLPPTEAAALLDKLTAGLNAYTSTLRAVA